MVIDLDQATAMRIRDKAARVREAVEEMLHAIVRANDLDELQMARKAKLGMTLRTHDGHMRDVEITVLVSEKPSRVNMPATRSQTVNLVALGQRSFVGNDGQDEDDDDLGIGGLYEHGDQEQE